MKMASSVASRKSKARRLQQLVVARILELYPELTDRDVKSVPMGVIGPDIELSQKGFELFPFTVECKNQEKISIWEALKQTTSEAREGTPLLVFSRNRSDVYCALRFEDFLKLLKR